MFWWVQITHELSFQTDCGNLSKLASSYYLYPLLWLLPWPGLMLHTQKRVIYEAVAQQPYSSATTFMAHTDSSSLTLHNRKAAEASHQQRMKQFLDVREEKNTQSVLHEAKHVLSCRMAVKSTVSM